MQKWILLPAGLALLTAAACGETRTQQATTGAGTGLLAGAIVGGPIGAIVGAGIGAAGGAYKQDLEPQADQAVDSAFRSTDQEVRAAINGENAPGSRSTAVGSSTTPPPPATAVPPDRQSQPMAAAPPGSDQQATRAAPASLAGLNRDTVREAQTALALQGIYTGEIDGVYGPQTTQAVREFQTDQSLPVTGELDGRTMRQLQIAARNGG